MKRLTCRACDQDLHGLLHCSGMQSQMILIDISKVRILRYFYMQPIEGGLCAHSDTATEPVTRYNQLPFLLKLAFHVGFGPFLGAEHLTVEQRSYL